MEICVDVVTMDSGRKMVKIKTPGTVRDVKGRPVYFIECTVDEAIILADQIRDSVAVARALASR